MLDRSARRILVAVVLTVVLAMALGVLGLRVLLTPKEVDAGRGPAAEVAREEEGPHVTQGAPPVQNREEVHKIAVEVDSQPSAETPIPPAPLHEQLISELLLMPLPPQYSLMIGSKVPGVNYDLLTSFRNTSEYKELMAYVRAQGKEGAAAITDHIMSILQARHNARLEACAGNIVPLLNLGHMEPGYSMCLPLILPDIDVSQREVSALIQLIDEDVTAQTEAVLIHFPDRTSTSAISTDSLFAIHALDCYLSIELDAYNMDPASFPQEQLAVLEKYGRLKESIRSMDIDSDSHAALNNESVHNLLEQTHQSDHDRHILATYGQWVPTNEFSESSYDETILQLARQYWKHF